MTTTIIARKGEVKALETLETATAVWDTISHDICISFQAGSDFKEGDPIEGGIGAAIAMGLGMYNQPNVMRFYPKADLQKVCIEAILRQRGWEIMSVDEE